MDDKNRQQDKMDTTRISELDHPATQRYLMYRSSGDALTVGYRQHLVAALKAKFEVIKAVTDVEHDCKHTKPTITNV